jgi:4-carboxymuconolactone decarboxylase
MPGDSSAGRKAFGDLAPALADYTDRVLFGDVWERPGSPPATGPSSRWLRWWPCTA